MTGDEYTHNEFLSDYFDSLVEDGIRIRAVCDDLEMSYEQFRAIFEIHTVFSYNPQVESFFRENRDSALVALDYLISSVDLSKSSLDSRFKEIDDAVNYLTPDFSETIRECERYINSFHNIDSFIQTNFNISKRLYEDEKFLQTSLELYLSKVMPIMASYDEYKVECAFDSAKEREYKKQKEILDNFLK